MHFKVIIVGAGAAGLTAADKISQAGHSVAVVEARDRIGGRIHTLKSPFHAEAGAEFMHGMPPATMGLLKDARLNFTQLDGKIYSIYSNNLSLGDPHEREREKFVKTLDELEEDTTVGRVLSKYFAEDKPVHTSVKQFAEGFDAADTERMSASSLRSEWKQTDNDEQFRINGTYSALIQHLQKRITMRGCRTFLSMPVRQVRWNPGHVSVFTDSTVLRADKVLITVPI